MPIGMGLGVRVRVEARWGGWVDVPVLPPGEYTLCERRPLPELPGGGEASVLDPSVEVVSIMDVWRDGK